MQKVLWDRRTVLAMLDSVGVRTPRRIEVDRDSGPALDPQIAEDLQKRLGIDMYERRKEKTVEMRDEDTLVIDGEVLEKPYVEKPVSGEDHNIHIYFPKSRGGGGRRLFRKVSRDDRPEGPRWIGGAMYEANSSRRSVRSRDFVERRGGRTYKLP